MAKIPTRNIFTSMLIGRHRRFDVPKPGSVTRVLGGDVLKGGGRSPEFHYAGKVMGANDTPVHFFNTPGSKGPYRRYEGDLKGNLTEMARNSVLSSGKETSHVNKMIAQETRANESGVIGRFAKDVGITGGVLGAAARNPTATAVLGAGTTLIGTAGSKSYGDVSRSNYNNPETWGIGQTSSVPGEFAMSKRSHIESFITKKAAATSLAQYLAVDAATDTLKGTGDTGGVMGGLSYTLARKLLPLSTRIRLPDEVAKTFATQFSGSAGKEAFDTFNKTMQGVFGRVRERNVDVPRRRQILQELRMSDPVLKGLPEDELKSWYNTLSSYAPNVSLDKNLVSSFLKQVALHDGQIDYGKLQELLDLEGAYQKIHLKSGAK